MYLTIDELARMLNISQQAIRYHIEQGHLKYHNHRMNRLRKILIDVNEVAKLRERLEQGQGALKIKIDGTELVPDEPEEPRKKVKKQAIDAAMLVKEDENAQV